MTREKVESGPEITGRLSGLIASCQWRVVTGLDISTGDNLHWILNEI